MRQVPRKLTTLGVVKRLEVSAATVLAWEKAGKLTATRTEGGIRLFDPDEVEHLAAQLRERRRHAEARS